VTCPPPGVPRPMPTRVLGYGVMSDLGVFFTCAFTSHTHTHSRARARFRVPQWGLGAVARMWSDVVEREPGGGSGFRLGPSLGLGQPVCTVARRGGFAAPRALAPGRHGPLQRAWALGVGVLSPLGAEVARARVTDYVPKL